MKFIIIVITSLLLLTSCTTTKQIPSDYNIKNEINKDIISTFGKRQSLYLLK